MDRLIILLSTQIIGVILVSGFDKKLHLSSILDKFYNFSDRFKPGVTVLLNIAVVVVVGIIYIFFGINSITFNLVIGLFNGYCIGAYNVYCHKRNLSLVGKTEIKQTN